VDASADVHAALETEDYRNRQWGFILECLDRTEARVLLLHYGQELPLRAVSRMLGLTNKSGAKAYIVSARRKLRSAPRFGARLAAAS
jgi:DNA-directed RNA polymerase specialized sigma24 family protein